MVAARRCQQRSPPGCALMPERSLTQDSRWICDSFVGSSVRMSPQVKRDATRRSELLRMELCAIRFEWCGRDMIVTCHALDNHVSSTRLEAKRAELHP